MIDDHLARTAGEDSGKKDFIDALLLPCVNAMQIEYLTVLEKHAT